MNFIYHWSKRVINLLTLTQMLSIAPLVFLKSTLSSDVELMRIALSCCE